MWHGSSLKNPFPDFVSTTHTFLPVGFLLFLLVLAQEQAYEVAWCETGQEKPSHGSQLVERQQSN